MQSLMTKRTFILLILGIVSTMALMAEMVDLRIVTKTGELKTIPLSVDTTELICMDDDTRDSFFQMKWIENLDVLPNLQKIELYNLNEVQDYSFLLKAKKLTFLHIAGGTINDLRFVEGLTDTLEYLYLHGGTTEKNLFRNSVDMSNLMNLKFLAFSLYGFTGVPSFVNVQNRPYIDLSNCEIHTLHAADIRMLRQFSLVNLKFTPIEKSESERAKLKDIRVVYESDPLPEYILDYYR